MAGMTNVKCLVAGQKIASSPQPGYEKSAECDPSARGERYATIDIDADVGFEASPSTKLPLPEFRPFEDKRSVEHWGDPWASRF
jgi:hypothetical protein